MRPKSLGELPAWQVGVLAIAWLVGVFSYMALRGPLALTPWNLGPDDYYIEAHVQYVTFVAVAPPVLLVAAWLWTRRAMRARQRAVAPVDERSH